MNRRRIAYGLTLTLAASLLTTASVARAATAAFAGLNPQVEPSIAGSTVDSSITPGETSEAEKQALTRPPAVTWPAAGVASLSTVGTTVERAGSLPVAVSLPPSAGGTATGPGVRVEVLDHRAADAAGRALLLRMNRSDAQAAATVRVSVDYSTFAGAYGGDYASRLGLALLPECGLTTPDAAECDAIPISSTNNASARTVTADVSVTGAGSMLALSAAPSGGAGDYTATALSPSSTWQAGGSSGDFGWSYPLRMPPSLGGPTPDVTFSYSAQSVDGHTAASNNQPSWLGEGFNYSPGSITRGYKACADDMGGTAVNTTKTGDQCWATYNGTLSMSGHGGELIRDDTTGTYRLKGDDGTRVQLLTGAANGANGGEYWKITTTDGTQYYFGLNHPTGWTSGASTNSTWTVPVYGNNPGEPCYDASWANASCLQAWQWNLDYVVDVHGNTMSLWYTPETNHYARRNTATEVATYTRGGYLTRIDYGTNNRGGTDTGLTASAPMRVTFTPADRCIPGSTCDFAHPASWPDVPVDQNCASTTSCTGFYSPSFWTQKRLSEVRTQVWGGSAYRDVDTWTLTHSYPDPGDGTRAGLWLNKISHAGLIGGKATVPDITFGGIQLQNRVDTNIDGSPAMNWWRVNTITTEAGGVVTIAYSPQQCVAGATPAADNNTKRCFPAYWTRAGQSDPAIDWFHRYVVLSVTETDKTGGNPRKMTSYAYATPISPIWHYDFDDGLVPAKRKTWGQWRGYQQVDTTVGDPGSQIFARVRYFQGMNGDKTSTGTRSITIDGIADDDAYAGMTRETIQYNGSVAGGEVAGTVSTPWKSNPTATRTIGGVTVYARHVGVATTVTRTDRDAGRAPRTHTVTTTFDGTYGLPTKIADNGDDAVSVTDDQCTTYTRVNNTSAWIIGLVAREEVYGLPCGTAPSTEADVVSDTKNLYDHLAYLATPTKGELTEVDTASQWTSPSAVTYLASKSNYDAYGRVIDSWDPKNHHAGTAYTPATGGPVTRVTTTNTMGWSSYADFEPAWNLAVDAVDANGRRADLTYDPLGRLTAVWKPGRLKGSQTASMTFSYALSNTGLSYTVSNTLSATGGYVSTYDLRDSLLRPRQTQTQSATGTGRVLADTFYDSAGRAVKANAPYYNSAAGPGATLFVANDVQVPSQTVTVYDGAGRVTASILRSEGTEKWRTTTVYGGDHIDVTPPSGGTPTKTGTDIFDRPVSFTQYNAATPTGTGLTSTYTYDRRNKVAQVTDPTGSNRWKYTYDLFGHVVTITDPGRTTDLTQASTVNKYDELGNLTSTLDVKRNKTLAYTYDDLNRRTGEYDTTPTGTPLLAWTYDTAVLASDGVTPARGQLASTTRNVGANAYVNTVRGYTDSYQVTGNNIVIPTSEGMLAGTFIYTATYNPDGSTNTQRYPGGGGLSAETLTLGYDATTGLPITLSGYVTGTVYTALGEPTVTTLSAGGKLAQIGTYYETATRRTSELVTARETAPSTVADVHYTYDAAGEVTKVADTANGDTQCMRSDNLQRLNAAWTPASGDCASLPTAALSLAGPAPYWQSWTFADQTGNRATQVDHRTTGDAITTYTYGTSGQAQPNRLVSTNAGTYGYDSAGNTTSRPGPHGQQTLTWDIEGHLASATDTTGTTSYVYDGSGNRLVARDPTGATLYLPGMELRLTTSTDTVAGTRYYQHNGRNVAQRTPQGVTWLSVDALSTTSVAIDSTTQSATIRRQTPYGTTRGATTWVNPHGFMGGVDGPTGLTHIGARDYDAATGRFVSVDPVFDRRSPQTWNGYAYAGNAPVTYADRSGTRRCLPDDDGCEEINGTTVHAPHKDPLEVVVHKVYSNGTILKKYRNGTVTINGLGIPPGCKDPFLLAQTVDDLWGREQTEAPVVDHFDPPTAARTLTLMLQACNTVGCSRDFKENVAQARNHLVEAVISHDRELARDLVFAKAGIITAGTLFCLFGGEEVCGPALFFSFLGFTTANASVYLSGNHPKWTEFFIAEGIDLASAYAGMFGGGGWGISKIEDFPRYADWTLRSTSAASGGGLLLDSTSVEQWTIMNEADEDEGPADLGAVSIGP